MKFLYIVGAGASCDYDFPTGESLKEQIEQKLKLRKKDDYNFVFANEAFGMLVHRYCNNDPQKIERLKVASQKITTGLYCQKSIDNFLFAHVKDSDIVFMAKLAIIVIIREHEVRLGRNGGDKIRKSWFAKFFATFAANCNFDDFKKRIKDVGFIVFNYDMCIEYCMSTMISHRFSVAPHVADELVSQLKIVHPYGSTKYRNDLTVNYNHAKCFEEESSNSRLIESVDNIITFSEGWSDDYLNSEIRNMLAKCQKMVLLGYGFIDINKILLLNAIGEGRIHLHNVQKVLGTCYGISPNDINDIKGDWIESFGLTCECLLENVDCSKLFDSNSRALMFK